MNLVSNYKKLLSLTHKFSFSSKILFDYKMTSSAAEAPKAKLASEKSCYEEIMSSVDTFLFDCDGVIWHGDEAIQGAVKVISRLREQNKKVFFVSNNSTKTRDEYFSKFAKLGFDAKVTEVFGTAYTSALYLKDKVSADGKVYVVGSPAMEEELRKVGISCFGSGQDNQVTRQSIPEILEIPLDSKVEAVLVGMDGHISFTKLVKAASYLKNPNCKFVATNEDAHMPLPGADHMVIGTGVIVNSVCFAAQRQPDVWCGKPHSFMLDCINKEVEIDFSRALMVGDRMNTDILFGNKNKMKTLLVLSGVSSEETLEEACSDPQKQNQVPMFYLKSLNDWSAY